MSNKISNKNVANIEDDVKLVKRYLENSAYKESDSDFFKNGGWEMVDLEIPKAMANILAEREQILREKQDDKQDIKDFQNALNEENLRCANYAIENNEFKNRIQELEEELAKYKDIDYMFKIDSNENRVDMKKIYFEWLDSIPKQIVIDKMKENKQILDKTNDGNLRERLYIENGIMKELLKRERK